MLPRLASMFILAFCLFTIFAIETTESAYACSCVGITPQEALGQASAVFTGKAVAVEKVSAYQQVATFDVNETWKGVSSDGIKVSSSGYGDTCGVGFEVGKEYLVYAYGDGERELNTSICARSNQLEFAEADIAALGPGDTTFATYGVEVFQEIPVSFPFLYLIGIGAAIAGVIAFLTL